MRRVVGHRSGDFPAVLVCRCTFGNLNGCEDDFRFFLIDVDGGFTERHGEARPGCTTRPVPVVDGEADGLVGLARVFNLDAVVNFLLSVPILAAVGIGDDEIDTKHSTSRAVPGGGRDRHRLLGRCAGHVGRRRLLVGRHGHGGIAGALSGLRQRDVHGRFFVRACIDGPGNLGDAGGVSVAFLGGLFRGGHGNGDRVGTGVADANRILAGLPRVDLEGGWYGRHQNRGIPAVGSDNWGREWKKSAAHHEHEQDGRSA